MLKKIMFWKKEKKTLMKEVLSVSKICSSDKNFNLIDNSLNSILIILKIKYSLTLHIEEEKNCFTLNFRRKKEKNVFSIRICGKFFFNKEEFYLINSIMIVLQKKEFDNAPKLQEQIEDKIRLTVLKDCYILESHFEEQKIFETIQKVLFIL